MLIGNRCNFLSCDKSEVVNIHFNERYHLIPAPDTLERRQFSFGGINHVNAYELVGAEYIVLFASGNEVFNAHPMIAQPDPYYDISKEYGNLNLQALAEKFISGWRLESSHDCNSLNLDISDFHAEEVRDIYKYTDSRGVYLMATPNTYYFSKHDDYETRCPLPILADGKLDI